MLLKCVRLGEAKVSPTKSDGLERQAKCLQDKCPSQFCDVAKNSGLEEAGQAGSTRQITPHMSTYMTKIRASHLPIIHNIRGLSLQPRSCAGRESVLVRSHPVGLCLVSEAQYPDGI